MAPKQAVYIGSDIYKQSAFGQNHPLSYARQGSVLNMCRDLGWLPETLFRRSPVADMATLTRYHDADYASALKAADLRGKATIADRDAYNFGTMENPLFKGVFNRAATTVGGSILAAQLALQGHTAFHPSGGTHHGQPDKAHGFCYFNDPVFSIFTLLDAGLERVLYVDIDAHHGDGVEQAFQNEPRVSTLSIHEEKRWPYSGTAQDQAPGQINIPVPQGLNDSEFDYIFERCVRPYCEVFCPQAIVITCGADGLKHDPLSKMGLSNTALWRAVTQLRDMTDVCVVLGGGGYNPWTTVRCWVGLWGQFAGFEMPDILPEPAQKILRAFDSDLIDEEDRDSRWITHLADPPNSGSVRSEIKTLVAKLGICTAA